MGLDDIVSLSEAVKSGKHLDAEKLTAKLLTEGFDPGEILEKALLAAMEVVGRRFRDNEIFLPDVLVSARAMKTSMKLIEPLLIGSGRKPRGKVMLGTVRGDLHDIGKNIVSIMLQGKGYLVEDIGIDRSPQDFLAGIEANKPDLIGLSAMLTTTMLNMKPVIEELRSHNVSIPVMVGGAPLSQKFADEIGADGYARNASEAVELADRLFAMRAEDNS